MKHWIGIIASVLLLLVVGESCDVSQLTDKPKTPKPTPDTTTPTQPTDEETDGGIAVTDDTLIVPIQETNDVKPDEYKPRLFFNAKFEPRTQIILGAGQKYMDCLTDFVASVGTQNKPPLFMFYQAATTDALYMRREQMGMKAEFDKQGWFIMPQIGVFMTKDGSPELHYEHHIADSDVFDKHLDTLVKLLKEWNRPVFLRLGYEFSGEWNGYQPETFKRAWIKVAKKIKQQGADKQIALVWHYAANAKNKDYMSYYPGDEWVDWWAISLFTPKVFDEPSLYTFLDDAKTHKKPVMIGESTFRTIPKPDEEGPIKWQRFFKKYFDLIKKYPQIKSVCYINLDWNRTRFPAWGDTRLSQNKDTEQRFVQEISKPIYLKGGNKTETLRKLDGK